LNVAIKIQQVPDLEVGRSGLISKIFGARLPDILSPTHYGQVKETNDG
jgi:hypothetical protein